MRTGPRRRHQSAQFLSAGAVETKVSTWDVLRAWPVQFDPRRPKAGFPWVSDGTDAADDLETDRGDECSG